MTSVRRASRVEASDLAWAGCVAQATRAGAQCALFAGDAHQVLQGLPDGFVHTSLTSPPYWGARDYEHPGQIGLEDELDAYVHSLVQVFREVYRVLTDDGTAWLNLGDSYVHGAGTVDGRPPRFGWKRNKQLALVPFRVALALQKDGWWVRNAVVWHKPNAMPASVRDRLANAWEPVFLLTKSEQYYFDLDTVRVPHLTDDNIERARAERGAANGKAAGKGELRQWLNSPRHRSTIEGLREVRRRPNAPVAVELAAYLRAALERKGLSIQAVADHIGQPFERVRHYFRTDPIGSRLPPEATWEKLRDLLDLGTEYDDAMQVEVGDNVFRNHPKGRNPGDVQPFSLVGNPSGHFATMPPSLAQWALRATLPSGGVCLDPFMGSGTTGDVVRDAGGRFLGIDIHQHYIDAYADRHATPEQARTTGSRKARQPALL